MLIDAIEQNCNKEPNCSAPIENAREFITSPLPANLAVNHSKSFGKVPKFKICKETAE